MENNTNLVLQNLVQEYTKRSYDYFVKLAKNKSVEAFEREKDGDSFQVEVSAKFDNLSKTKIRCFIDVDTGKRLMKLLPITKEISDSFVIDSSGVITG